MAIKRPSWLAEPIPKTPLDALPPGSPTGKTAAIILAGEILSEFRAWKQTSTEFYSRLVGGITNDVLDVQSEAIDATKLHVSRQYHTAIGCIVVDNQSTANVMYVTPGGYNPGSGMVGPRSTPVPFGKQRVINLASRQFTIYGTAGDVVAWQCFTKGAAPMLGIGIGMGG